MIAFGNYIVNEGSKGVTTTQATNGKKAYIIQAPNESDAVRMARRQFESEFAMANNITTKVAPVN